MKKLALVFERLTFIRILSVWLMIVLSFGIIYYGLSYTNQHLIYNGEPLGNDALGLGNAIYFSFITATTIGYGDIAPFGASKVLAILEALTSMILFGVFIGKIVSVKQEQILEEIEELSLEEATNKAISDLYLFRNQAKEIIGKKFNLKEIEMTLQSLRSSLVQFNGSKIKVQEDHDKALMRLELISNSINFSLSRFVELLEAIRKHKTDWKNESTTPTVAECQKTLETLYAQYNLVKSDDELSNKVREKLEDLNKTLAALQKSLQKP
jgi:hypothetical protein